MATQQATVNIAVLPVMVIVYSWELRLRSAGRNYFELVPGSASL